MYLYIFVYVTLRLAYNCPKGRVVRPRPWPRGISAIQWGPSLDRLAESCSSVTLNPADRRSVGRLMPVSAFAGPP